MIQLSHGELEQLGNLLAHQIRSQIHFCLRLDRGTLLSRLEQELVELQALRDKIHTHLISQPPG